MSKTTKKIVYLRLLCKFMLLQIKGFVDDFRNYCYISAFLFHIKNSSYSQPQQISSISLRSVIFEIFAMMKYVDDGAKKQTKFQFSIQLSLGPLLIKMPSFCIG